MLVFSITTEVDGMRTKHLLLVIFVLLALLVAVTMPVSIPTVIDDPANINDIQQPFIQTAAGHRDPNVFTEHGIFALGIRVKGQVQ